MIRQLRLKFISITMGTLALVFAVVFLVLNAFMQDASAKQTGHLLAAVAANDGLPLSPRGGNPRPEGKGNSPSLQNPEMMRASRFFYVKVLHDGSYFETNYDMMFDFTEEEAFTFAHAVLARGRESGAISNLQYLVAAKDYGKILVFAERSIEIRMLTQLTEISLWVAGGTCVVLLIFSFFLSKWAVMPVKIAFEKQRRFIADASHELKTPLTVISTNIEVLENETGGNIRFSHIKAQCERMGALIHDLLSLAKADEGTVEIVMAEFDLSKAVLNATLEFESRAFEEGKELRYQITEDMLYTGDERQVRQLASILIDNAIRYSDIPGRIEIALGRENGRPMLSVFNTGSGIPAAERERVFDRFYRSESSRSRETGGYGLGLSIARAIVQSHKGKIIIAGKAGEWVKFSVYL